MKPEEYEVMFQAEEHHWWYAGMERITRAILNRWYTPGAGLRILDAGCGTGGAMTFYLSGYGQVTGFDFAAEALVLCRRRRAERLVRASVMQIPFADGTFDLVTSFDVLCEQAVLDDATALREMYRVLVPGGRVLLRLPAYNWLRGQHDRAVYIRHRYTSAEIADILRRSGFRVEHLSYANMFLFPLAVAKRMAERIWPLWNAGSDLTIPVGPLNGLLGAILSAEARYVAYLGLPFGLTVVAVGRKL